jgi:type I restriction enzyme M protein
MQWIAPSEKDIATDTLEKRLWAAADQLRANSGLTAQQYSQPVLGLIFLRFAEVRFEAQRAKLEKASASSRRGSRIDDPTAYHAEGVLYLTPNARFAHLLALPEGANIGRAVNDAMADIEKHNPQLAGVLPRTFQLFASTLLKELLKKVSEIPASVNYDAFGRIYEYFLGEFARTEGHKGGEFYTPACIVRLIVEILEPFHGRVLDPACGSGGMFVQSARFVAEHKKDPSKELSVHGVEKTDETGRLCRMNLAIHGLEGDIRHGGQVNSYYDDPFDACCAGIEPSPAASRHPLPVGEGRGEGHGIERHGRFDFVLANPPFNVNAVDKERLKDSVGPGRRFPFGLPRTDNANYLWIQLFYSALNEKGRAGFVMANSASDARSSEQELRRQLIEARAVDVMVAVGPNLFYTVTLPCTLWFMDKAKATLPPRPPSPGSANRPLPEVEGRGGFKFQGLVEQARELRRKQTPAEDALWELLRNRQLGELKFRRQHQIGDYIVDFFCAEHGLIVELDGSVHGTPDRKKTDAKRDAYLRSLGHTVLRFSNARVFDDTEKLLAEIAGSIPSTSGRGAGGEGEQHGARYSDTVLFIDARHIYRQIDRAHREWTPAQIGFLGNIVRLYRGETPDFTLGGDEARAKLMELFAAQPSTRPSGHPSPSGRRAGNEGAPTLRRYRDIPGLCRVATISEIGQQGWSLNPGRYVGVAPGESVSDEDFKEQLETLNEELETLNTAARELEATIAKNVAEILET